MDPLFARAAQRLLDFGNQHRRGLMVALVTSLAGFGITAFGIAPLAPDAAALPQRLVAESVQPEAMTEQLDALAAQQLSLYRSDISRATDTPDSLLARVGINDREAAAFLRSDAIGRRLMAGRGGKMVQVRSDATGALVELVARFPSERTETARTHFTRLTVARVAGRLQSRIDNVALAAQVRLGSGTIRSTLFAATDEARLPDAIAGQLAEIFNPDIDFHRELHKGDSFSVVYEALTADGEPVAWNDGAGRVLAAEFSNGGKTYQAVWFAGQDGRGAYFAPDGSSRKRSFLASPMGFSRITSGFAMRMHPLLQSWRQHKGVDYAAPIGTPVRSVGDGIIEFAGWQGGYGNVVVVDHGRERTTLYAHLSRVLVRKGQNIGQGQEIGSVGMTGWTTGPHLHFEFRVDGVHKDPLTIAKAADPVLLDALSRPRFTETARAFQAKLDVAESLASGRQSFE